MSQDIGKSRTPSVGLQRSHNPNSVTNRRVTRGAFAYRYAIPGAHLLAITPSESTGLHGPTTDAPKVNQAADVRHPAVAARQDVVA